MEGDNTFYCHSFQALPLIKVKDLVLLCQLYRTKNSCLCTVELINQSALETRGCSAEVWSSVLALPHPGQERLAGSNNVAALAGVAALDGVHVAGVHIQRYNVAIGPGDSLYNRTLLLYVCFVL